MPLDFTLMTEKQRWGNDALDVMKKYGTAAAPTELAVLLGAVMTNSDERTSEGDLTCMAWSVSPTSYSCGDVHCVNYDGHMRWEKPNRRDISVRPVLSPSEVSKIVPDEAYETWGCLIVEYGEYPQSLPDIKTRLELEQLFQSKKLQTTGKNYTFDAADPDDLFTPFKATSYPEYELDGKKYIRVLGRPADDDSRLFMEKRVEKGKPYWVQVEPIEWLLDPSGTMVAKKCLFSGIQFDTKDSYNGDFSKTFIKKYLDTYFVKEIETPAEREKRLKREEKIKGLKAKLAEAIDPEKVKAKVGFTRTESRREIAEAIKTTRRARDVFIDAAKKAQKEGDQELIDQIVEMADFYVRSDQAQRGAARQRRAESRAQRAAAKKDSQR